MKIYLEINENLTIEEAQFKQPQNMRVEVQSEEEASLVLASIISLFEGLDITSRIHFCNHENGLPCQLKEII